jgi:hypothetical protein
MEQKHLITLQDIQAKVDRMVLETPTGSIRNALTDINILLMSLIGGDPNAQGPHSLKHR